MLRNLKRKQHYLYALGVAEAADQLQLCLTALLAHGVFVEQVLSHAVLRSSQTTQVWDPVSQLFDGFHLLVQEMRVDEVAHL